MNISRYLIFLSIVITIQFFSFQVHGRENEVKIVFVSNIPDIYARKKNYFYAALGGYINMLRQNHESVLLLHGGDSLAPSPVSLLDNGTNVIRLANLLEVDLLSVGQRDLFFGLDQLSIRASEANFPLISSNLTDKRTAKAADGILPYYQLSANGVDFQISSLVNYEAKFKFNAPNASLQSASKKARVKQNKFAHILITDITAYQLEEQINTQDYDAVLRVGASENSVSTLNNTLLVISGGQSGKVAEVTYRIDSGWSVDWVDVYDFEQDIEIAKYIDRTRMANEVNNKHIAMTPNAISTRRDYIRTQENEFGNLVVDALKHFANTDIAIINSGSIRGNRIYSEGHDFTQAEIQQELPFGNYHSVLILTGNELLAALEHFLSIVERGGGRFLNVSGMQVSFNSQQAPCKRIIEVLVDGQPINKHAEYKVVMSEFLASGGNGYSMFQGKFELNNKFERRRIWHIVAEYMEQVYVLKQDNIKRLRDLSEHDG